MFRCISATILILVGINHANAQEVVELHSVILENGNVRVEYSNNFETCAHLYRSSTHTNTHYQNLFCESGEHVVKINPESAFRLLTAGERVYMRHGNGATVSTEVTVTHRPIANAGPDQTVEAVTDGALVELNATGSSDPDQDSLFFLWSVPAGIDLDDATSATPIGIFPCGITTATLTVTDEHGASSTDDVIITVNDGAPPEVVCTTTIASLAPANGDMVDVEVYIDATDNCADAANLILLLVTVESDEPDDANGKNDGSTTGDTNGADGYYSPVDVTDSFAFNPNTASFEGNVALRAERDKRGEGRAYTIRASVLDTASNLAESSCVVVVPNNGKGNKGKNRK